MLGNTFITLLLIILCAGKKYNNYTLYRVIPLNSKHLAFLSEMNMVYDVIYWKEPSVVYNEVDFIINPGDRQKFLEDAQGLELDVEVMNEDIQSAFDKQTVQNYTRRNMKTMNWNHFYRLDDIYDWLMDLTLTYPGEVSVMSIGRSHENRNILAVKIAFLGGKNRSTVMIEGGIHAREWISPAVVTYLIQSIINLKESSDVELKRVALNYEWYFVPVLNPDGYEYSHTEDRMWRKNRNGEGVDLNRNFGYGFRTAGCRDEESADSYCGRTAFSEKESKAMANFIKTNSNNLKYYFSFHSYGQYMILPYANTKQHLENYNEVYRMCKEAAKDIKIRYGTKYEIGLPIETVGYSASGLSTCWVKHTFKVPYVVIFELRDTGKDGFALPSEKILPTADEVFDGLMSLLTPRDGKFVEKRLQKSGQTFKILDTIVIVFNVFLFIIVRFE